MNNQLSKISTQYRKFSKGQYIEEKQFNEFLDFFEDQDRLSRVMLQGVGIVCGLRPEPVYKNRFLNGIQLSQGVALTTDGDLLTLSNTGEVSKELYVSDLRTIDIQSKNYTHFKIYDNFKVKYPAFYDADNKQIELWELATVQEANSDFQPINKLSGIENKYLLLYLEDYEKEVKPCRGVDCDNHGIQQIRNLKVLVTTKEGIARILEKDKIQPHPLFITDMMTGLKQERVIIERLILERGIDADFSSLDLKNLYSGILVKNNYGENIFKKINAISEVFGISGVDHKGFKQKLITGLAQTGGFQYAYDVVKDLTDTYSEIIKLLPASFARCLPDLLSFPKHVMLGKVAFDFQLDSSRHQFYHSPVLDDKKMTSKVKVLMNRFKQQAQNFRYSDSFETSAAIKIRPSQKANPLGNKAIPFYYNVTTEFLKAWSFDKTANRLSGYNLGYDQGLLSTDNHVQKPLDFNIDKNSFYNIEGHQGMNHQEAFDQITQIRNQRQLGFDVMLLSFTELKNNKDLYRAYFNEYVDKHPGLEHTRGVERGGTFVMVYEQNGRSTNVIADFSLPYQCCTPKVEVKLSLPKTTVCSDSGLLPFTVSPANGEVKASVDAGLNGGVKQNNGNYVFDPSSVSEALYNTDISFTVNGKTSDCSIKVIPQPKVNISVSSVDYPTNGSSATTVHFTVSGTGFAGYEYNWDFWDDGGFIPLKPDGNGMLTYTLYNLNPKQIPMIKVKVSNKECVQTIALRDWYKGPVEEENRVPVAIANASYTNIQLPTNSVELKGSSSYDSDGTIVSYVWKQIGTTPAIASIGNPNTADTAVTGLVEGTYTFQLTVKDNKGATASNEVMVTVNKAAERNPSLTEIGNSTTGSGSGGSRTQTFKVGQNVSAGNKFQAGVYSVVLTVTATASDTPDTVASKLRDLINNTTREQWNAAGTAPTGASGFPPKASSSGDTLVISLNYQNQFFGSASVS